MHKNGQVICRFCKQFRSDLWFHFGNTDKDRTGGLLFLIYNMIFKISVISLPNLQIQPLFLQKIDIFPYCRHACFVTSFTIFSDILSHQKLNLHTFSHFQISVAFDKLLRNFVLSSCNSASYKNAIWIIVTKRPSNHRTR